MWQYTIYNVMSVLIREEENVKDTIKARSVLKPFLLIIPKEIVF